MGLKTKIKKVFFPCQDKIEFMMQEHKRACDKLQTVVADNFKNTYPDFNKVPRR